MKRLDDSTIGLIQQGINDFYHSRETKTRELAFKELPTLDADNLVQLLKGPPVEVTSFLGGHERRTLESNGLLAKTVAGYLVKLEEITASFAVIGLFNNPSKYTRSSAAYVTGFFGQVAVKPLINALTATDSLTRLTVIDSLTRMNNAPVFRAKVDLGETIEPLIARFIDPSETQEVRCKAIELL